MIKGVLFDMDGTLVDSMKCWYKSGFETVNEFFKEEEFSMIHQLDKMSAAEIMDYVEENIKDPIIRDNFSSVWFKKMTEYYKTVLVKNHVYELLGKYEKLGYRMGIATGTALPLAIPILARTNLLPHFKFVISEALIGHSKHDPEIYLEGAKRLGYKPEEVMVFEDGCHGAKTAKDAGFYVVGVYDESSAKQKEMMQAFCDIYINDYSELL